MKRILDSFILLLSLSLSVSTSCDSDRRNSFYSSVDLDTLKAGNYARCRCSTYITTIQTNRASMYACSKTIFITITLSLRCRWRALQSEVSNQQSTWPTGVQVLPPACWDRHYRIHSVSGTSSETRIRWISSRERPGRLYRLHRNKMDFIHAAIEMMSNCYEHITLEVDAEVRLNAFNVYMQTGALENTRRIVRAMSCCASCRSEGGWSNTLLTSITIMNRKHDF